MSEILSKKSVRTIIIALLLCLGSVVFLLSQIRFKKERDKDVTEYILTSDLKKRIAEICIVAQTPQTIIEGCSKITCSELSFAANNDIPNGKANCVGYAQLTSAMINYAFKTKNLPYKSKPVVGKVYLFGVDLNNVTQYILPSKHRPFFKDHDFVEIDLGNQTVYIDSSLQDLTLLTFMQTQDK